MGLFHDHADVSVRPATREDEATVARVQLRAWRAHHAELLGAEVLEALDVMAIRTQWSHAITRPPSRDHHVLVACEGAHVVGFAASVPAPEGIEVIALEVDPDHERGGHGSRLLAACVDLGRESDAHHLQTWVLAGDTAREQFLRSAGLGPDGGQRELGLGTTPEGLTTAVIEHRWVAEI